MIKKINKLKYFGIFHDFLWKTGLPEFKKFNLIYGWNYSGKTTLSRVFRCFELGKVHKGKGYEDTTFEVELENGNKHNQLQLSLTFAVRVFNSDYVDENLKWKAVEEGIEPVLLVGKENIELEKQLEGLTTELKDKEAKIQQLRRIVQDENEKIEVDLTVSARRIKNTLNIPDFEKPLFKHFIRKVASNPTEYQLSDGEVTNCFAKYKSTKEEKIPKICLSIPNMPDFCNQTEILLKKTATASVIERLRENPILQEWISPLFVHMLMI